MIGASLRARLVLAVLAVSTLVWVGAALGTFRDAHVEIDRVLDAHLAQSARLLLQSGHELTELAEDGPADIGDYGQVLVVQAWDGGTRLVLRSATAPLQRLSPVESGFSDVEREGRRWRVFSAWDRERQVLVQVGEDHATRGALIRRVALNAALPILYALVPLGLLVWFVITRSLHPLRKLGTAVERRSASDLAPIDGEGVPTEALPLVERLNALLARFSASLQSERRFTAHAAHELRTPVAATRAQAEVALAATEDASRRAAIERVIVGCDRMARLVEQLLQLARLDEGAGEVALERCRLDSLAREVLADAAPVALERGLTVALEASGPILVQGRPDLLAVLLRNLVDNAIQHGSSEVLVRCVDDPGGLRVEVEDDGPGVDEAALSQLGHRFFRAAGAPRGGSGIGLTIVRRIAELHGAEVAFSRGLAPRSGLRVAVTFGAASGPSADRGADPERRGAG